jgi:hypothetical protein
MGASRGSDGGLRSQAPALATFAARGEVLPTWMHLAEARAKKRWDDRAFLVAFVGPAAPLAVLGRACELMPRAPEPRLLRASRRMDESRAASHLLLADADLVAAARLDDADPTPHAMRIAVAHTLGALPMGRAVFRDAIARDPNNHLAFRNVVKLLAQRHGGSHAAQLQAARRAATLAAPRSDLYSCLFEAHVDIWLTMREAEGDSADSYLRNRWVREELDRAFDAWLVDGYCGRLGSGPGLGAAVFWYSHSGDATRLARARAVIREYDDAMHAA